MRFKRFFTKVISGYQYISMMLPKSCRYYPSCSEYAKWCFETTDIASATIKSTTRILRCNQLFSGGIDYPIVRYRAKECRVPFVNQKPKKKIKYWIIPKDSNLYTIVKDFNAYDNHN